MTRVSTSLFPLLFFARISGLIVAALVISWALLFKSSFLPQSSSHEDLIYAVLHPLLMVIGFILLSGEAILVHRWLPGSGNLKKSVHLCLQGVALASGIFGIWTKFQGKDGIVANFFSLHSWMGLICISLFGAQFYYGNKRGHCKTNIGKTQRIGCGSSQKGSMHRFRCLFGWLNEREKAEMGIPVVRFSMMTTLIRVIGLAVLVLVITWTFHFRGGVSLSSTTKDLTLIFNVHPVLLVISLILLNGEAMLAYKTVSGTKSLRKTVHLTIQSVVFLLSVIGVWAAYWFHNLKGVDDFYSLHSWLGLACLFFFSIQWAAGFSTFWYPGGSISSRASLLPWHVFFGIYIYALAIVTAATGFLEKATFLQVHHIISRYSTEALLVNTLGMLIVALGGIVILALVTPMNGKGNAYKPLEYAMQHPSV
ncbi:cytochrome B561, putative [Ricinus communis]|uniref:ascorbate ferrireductase (transmembrane) n=2 Tax=Ricinus communis TaxID=3988 RepID=B9SEH3_RICCO|nr:cytochrome B561, putative [Ricinus communis]